jgi:ABC-type nickel/cobalt efflux system permease component RcnA
VYAAVLALSTAAMLGFLHALEVDHMIAVTSFVSTRPTLRTAAGFGARWGLGHSIAVCLAGGILLVTGLRWPSRFDDLGEALVGVMLIGLGAWAIRASRKLHLHPPDEHGDHLHLHAHGDGRPVHHHPHSEEQAHADHHGHAHHHAHPHRSGHGITLVGMLHGLSGTSAVVALVPVTLMPSALLGLGYLAAFGVGVTAGMTVYAMVAAGAMKTTAERSLVWGKRMAAAVGVAGIGVGLWWVVTALA